MPLLQQQYNFKKLVRKAWQRVRYFWQILDTQAFSVSLHYISSHVEALPAWLQPKRQATGSIFGNKLTPNKLAKKSITKNPIYSEWVTIYGIWKSETSNNCINEVRLISTLLYLQGMFFSCLLAITLHDFSTYSQS